MQVTRVMLKEAETLGLLRDGQALALWGFLAEREKETPSFKPATSSTTSGD